MLYREVEENIREQGSQLAEKLNKDGIITIVNLGQDVKEAMTGGSVAVVGVNAILKENIVNKQITPVKTSFFKNTKNLFDKENVIENMYVLDTAGNLKGGANYYSTDFIPCLEGEEFISNSETKFRIGAFYDENKQYISGFTDVKTIVAPRNGYFRCSFREDWHISKENLQIEKGNKTTSYMPHLIFDEKFLVNTYVEEGEEDKKEITVTVGAPGDYATLSNAIENCVGNFNYRIKLLNGEHIVSNLNIYNDKIIEIFAEDKNKTILKTNGSDTPNVELRNRHGLSVYTNTVVRNLTIDVIDVKYCVHQDGNSIPYEAIFENCRFIHRGDSTKSYLHLIGIGAKANQINRFIDCEFISLISYSKVASGVYWHNWNNQSGTTSLYIENCKAINCSIAEITELGSNHSDRVEIRNSATNMEIAILVNANNTYYLNKNGEKVGNLELPYNIELITENINGAIYTYENARDYRYHNFGYETVISPNVSVPTGTPLRLSKNGYNSKMYVVKATNGIYDYVSSENIDVNTEYGYAVEKNKYGNVLCVAGNYVYGDKLIINSTGFFEKTTNENYNAIVVMTKNISESGLVFSKLT